MSNELDAAIDWYKNADWGNECFEDGVVRDFKAGAAYQRAQPSDDVAKDAARYQWLVKHSTYGIDYRQRPGLTLSIYAPDHRDGLSAAIDAAMAGVGE